ncbi:MAG: DedA family protein [Phycisphaerae bacterium]|nr:DedA family protein [Phycisphaerae bacterium]NIU08338.1 DedA family protein [Phycisphaerae bacterium]NIU55834.1 DedA family protein [Phycisphaerae bacterium]NIW92346.1 DedA family protein [Phycisphaerae bacterium]NIX27367.1 DedA family protein [Phycisphaerae bacterium]
MAEQFVQETVQFINTLPPSSIYLVFFLVAYVENIVPPIPGDVLVAFGGYLAAEAVIGLVPVLLLTTVASVIGFMSMYWIGSRWGVLIQEKKKQFWLLRFIPLKYINKVRAWMRRWGMGVILANRFLAGTRSVISLTAGLSHTRIGSTIFYSTVSSLLWNSILLGFGWIVHENWQLIGKYLSIYGRIIIAGIAIFIIIKVILYYYNKRSTN